jgi:lysophospholipase L1-like esterase
MQETMTAEFTEAGFYCLPYNLGVSGDTVDDILPRLKSEVQARLDPENPNEVVEFVFSIGVNDSVHMVAENRPRFTDQEFENNLKELIKLSKTMAQRISFIGIAPVDDDLLNPIPWAPEKAYACEHVERFEKIIHSTCQEYDLPFLPLFNSWLSQPDWQDSFIDGVHPNSKGHTLLAEQIGDFIITDEFRQFHTSA